MKKNTLLIVLITFFLTACSQDSPVIKIGTNVWPGYEPLYLASDRGLLPEKKFSLIELVSASQVMRELSSQTIDVAALTLDEAITLESRGVDIKIVLVMDYSNGGDAIVADKAFPKFAMLKGKRIAVEESAVGGYFLSRALEKYGMETSDVEIVSKLQHEISYAFLQNKVDAVVTFDPLKTKLLEKKGVVVFDSKQIPGEIVDVLVVRRAVYDQIKDQLGVLKAAWFESLETLRTEPAKAMPIINKRLKLDEKSLSLVMAGVFFPSEQENRKLLSSTDASSLRTTVARIKDYLEKHGRIASNVDVEDLF